MKRKIAWLALPLVLAALMLGVRWRREHPTLTQLDLEMRGFVVKPYLANILYYPYYLPSRTLYSEPTYYSGLSKEELRQLANCMFILPRSNRPSGKSSGTGAKGVFRLSWFFHRRKKESVRKMTVDFNIGERDNKFVVEYTNRQVEYKLHPNTAKRWMELLLSSPRIGPQLRARMKS